MVIQILSWEVRLERHVQESHSVHQSRLVQYPLLTDTCVLQATGQIA